jgi:hypothetical protein
MGTTSDCAAALPAPTPLSLPLLAEFSGEYTEII